MTEPSPRRSNLYGGGQCFSAVCLEKRFCRKHALDLRA
jgi:hypothetical protein